MHISRLNGPPGFFYTHPHPNQMYSVNSPHSPPHENVIHSSLSSPHPISEPLSLTPLNRLNSTKHAYFQTQWPPWFLLYTPPPQPNFFSQLPIPSPHTKMSFILFSLFTPPNLWALVLDPSESLKSYQTCIFPDSMAPLGFFIHTLTPTKCIQSTPHTLLHTKMSFILLSLHPTQSLSPCPWPLWIA